jgi:peptidoglycan hydrolase-like protein with peptidoglycan-binding domain
MASRAALLAAVLAAVWLAAPDVAAGAGHVNVAALQVALRARSLYTGTIDGYAGPQTHAAVRRFQRRAGLQVDGIAGPRTRRALGRLGRPPLGTRVIAPGAVGWDVAALQFRLAWHGFPSGAFDGVFGPRTQAAVLGYQRWAGLAVDGIAGPATLGSLRRHRIPASPLRVLRPVGGPIGDRFGPRGDRFHTGVDLLASTGTAVAAAASGRVIFAGYSAGGYGNLVVLRHRLGVSTWYAHLSRILVRLGQRLRRGAQLGRVGATGNATGPHLHFEVRVRGAAVDPRTAFG